MYDIHIGNADSNKNDKLARHALSHTAHGLMRGLKHGKASGDRVHLDQAIPAGDYSIDGKVESDGSYTVTLTPGVES